jgi:hypothetical protein
MAYDHCTDALATAPDQPLVGLLVDDDGRQIVRYFVDDQAAISASSDDTLQAALAVIGAWSDLDWDEFSTDLDRIRHANRPTPPIDLDV